MEKEDVTVFETLRAINLESKHKQKGKLTYLPWATAWATVKLAFPDANYDTIKDENGNLIEVHCTYDPETKSGSGCTGRKPRGSASRCPSHSLSSPG